MKTRITLSSALLALGWISGTADLHSQGNAPTVFQQPDSSRRNPFYPGNRPPLKPSPFIKLPIGAITPQGWLKRQLELDVSGMCGNLAELSNFIKDGCAWASPTGEGHHGWEEPMYWLRGYGDLGYVLKDEAINTVSRKWIEAMQELWLATADRGLCASLYAASDVTAKVGDGTQVTIREETDYPFGETITFTLSMKNAVKFPLYLRLPRWCDNPQVAII